MSLSKHAVLDRVIVQVASFTVGREGEFEPSDNEKLFSSAECSLLLYHCLENTPYTPVSSVTLQFLAEAISMTSRASLSYRVDSRVYTSVFWREARVS